MNQMLDLSLTRCPICQPFDLGFLASEQCEIHLWFTSHLVCGICPSSSLDEDSRLSTKVLWEKPLLLCAPSSQELASLIEATAKAHDPSVKLLGPRKSRESGLN